MDIEFKEPTNPDMIIENNGKIENHCHTVILSVKIINS